MERLEKQAYFAHVCGEAVCEQDTGKYRKANRHEDS